MAEDLQVIVSLKYFFHAKNFQLSNAVELHPLYCAYGSKLTLKHILFIATDTPTPFRLDTTESTIILT